MEQGNPMSKGREECPCFLCSLRRIVRSPIRGLTLIEKWDHIVRFTHVPRRELSAWNTLYLL